MKTISSFSSKLLAFTLALMASVASFAYDEMPDFQVDGLYYNFLEGDNVEVTHPYRPEMPTEGASTTATQDSYDDYAEFTELIIPSTIPYEGMVYNVTRIGYAAFDQCYNLTYVDIPSSIKTIGVAAFSNCSSLTSITLKEGLEHIEGNAFADCRLLETITFPNSLKTVGSYAFSFTAWYNNQPNGGVYAGNVFYKYKGDIPENTSFVIKEGTVSISPDAFIKENRRIDYGLVAVAIPNSVEIIGEYAFSQCRALRSVNIPSRVTTIESYAFSYCKSLTSVTSEIVEPLSLPSDVFFNASVANATLYVPAESVEAYKNADQWKNFGQILPIAENPEDLFPTLWGLQRTEVEYHTDGADAPSLVSFEEYTPTFVNGKWYLYDGRNYLREENNQVLLYSPEFEIYEDVVLYDWALEIGDTLPFTIRPFDDDKMRGAVFRVTDVSTITLLDGKEYKKWTLACGIEYIEGIGAINGEGFGNYFCLQHSAHPATYIDTRLVCASRNGQLLYQMDDTEMERLGAECLCAGYLSSYKSQWCDTWNVMWFDGMRFDETASTSQYRLGKDTIIGDYTYSKFTSRTSVRFTNDRKVYVYYEGFDDNDPYTVDLPTGEYLAYDFSAQVGDTLEVFSGIGTYSTYPYVVDDVETAPSPCVVDDVQADLKTFPLIIKLRPLCDVDGEGNMEISSEEITWIEGVGSPEGFLISSLPCGWGGGGTFALLCAYKGDELKYTGSLYDEYGCEYNANDPQLPLVEWCNQWNILAHGYLGPQEPLYGAKTTIYQLGADTIINHLRYKQLTRYASDDVNQTKTYVGAIRFTKNNRQVYFYYDNAEYLLYDFKAQVGDTLEVFAGIDNYRDHKTYKHVVTNKEPIQDEQCKVTLDVFVPQERDGEIIHEEKFTSIWIEGVGSPDGIVHNCATLREGNVVTDLLCAYVDDRQMYRTPYPDYRILGCEYNEGDFIEGAFPMLSGLQRTICNEYCEDSKTSLQKFEDILFEHDKPYIYCESAFLIREENNKILIYSHSLDKDLVLYDFTLEVGDSLPRLYLDESAEKDLYWIDYNIMNVVDYHKDLEGNILPADTLIVTDVSAITLLDGKEYKKWTFNNGMEYVEGIGSFGNNMQFLDFFQLIGNMAVPVSLHGTHLVCVSKNGKLLYQMDDAEMERLGAECLCDYDSGHRKDNAKDGQIGGRPTPTQWNQLEVVLREMDNNHTILQAETFSYTLEDISQQVNNKTYFQLARQSTKDTATTKSVVGALHFGKDEDNRVYFLRDGVEYVLYDFTAEPGDTVEIFAGINNYPQETTYTHVVTGKDTLENGACRMLLEVVFPDETNTTAENAEKVWLAGLGSVDGIVHNAAKRTSNAHAAPSRSADSNETETSVMLCAWREDSCLYTTDHPDYDSFGCVYNQDPTSVENTHSPLPMTNCQKIIRNEQLLILHEGKTYNVLGVQIK